MFPIPPRMRRLSTLLLAGTLAAPLACGDSNGQSDGGGNGSGGGQNGWTVLVYMAADNNLEKFGLLDLTEMAGVGSSTGLNIIAQADRSVGYTSDGVLNLPDWATTKRLQISKGSFTQISDLGVTDMADPAVLSDFIKWGVKAYPASHYMLVLWDHGGGWTGFGLDEDPSAGATQSDWMTLSKITTGVSGGLQAAGLAKFDVIGFDACMMATLEVAESMKPYGNYLLGSEETEPGHGWDYGALAGAASLDAVSLSKKIIDGYQGQANSADWKDGASITLSLIDLAKLGPIETALTALSGQYGNTAAMTPVSGAVGRLRATALAFGKNPDPASDFNQVDMGDLFGKLAQTLGADSTSIQTAVTGAVVYQVKGSAYSSATGMSVYFPPDAANYKATYDSLPGLDDWRPFVKAYYGVASSSGAVVPKFDQGNSTYDAAATMTLDGALASGALAYTTSAFLVYGLPGSGTDAWLYGESPAAPSNTSGVDHVIGTWDYSFLRLSQDAPASHVEFGYLQLSVSATTATVSIPLNYYESASAQPQVALRQIVIDVPTSAVSSDVTYLSSGSGQLGQLTPAAGSTLRALVGYLPDATQWARQWLESTTTGAFDATQPITLDLPALDSGAAFFAGLRIENATGNGDWVATPVSPPPTKP
jgi:Clostripain family